MTTEAFDVRRFMSRPEWMDDAQCRGMDPDLFLPVENLQKPAGARILADAREVCRRCDVQAECLAFALNGREHGIWAGTTDSQRRRILRAQNQRGPLPCELVDELERAAKSLTTWRSQREQAARQRLARRLHGPAATYHTHREQVAATNGHRSYRDYRRSKGWPG